MKTIETKKLASVVVTILTAFLFAFIFDFSWQNWFIKVFGYGSSTGATESDYQSPVIIWSWATLSWVIDAWTWGTLTWSTTFTITSVTPIEFTSTGNVSVVLPVWLQITSASTWTINISQLSAVKLDSLPIPLSSNETEVWKISFWVSNVKLNFSKPVKINIPVPWVANWTMAVKVKHSWDNFYSTDSLTNLVSSTCSNWVASTISNIATVLNWVATIYSCSASDFVAYNSVSSSSSSSSSSWWGWWGNSWLRMDKCPDWDFSPTYYDKTCWVNQVKSSEVKTEISTNVKANWVIQFTDTKEKWDYKLVKITWSDWILSIKSDKNTGLSLEIPSWVWVVWLNSWDSKIASPTFIVNDRTKKAWVVLVDVWSTLSKLTFNKQVQIIVPTDYIDWQRLQVYTSLDWKKWIKHSEVVSNSWKATIVTNYLSYYVLRPIAWNLVINPKNIAVANTPIKRWISAIDKSTDKINIKSGSETKKVLKNVNKDYLYEVDKDEIDVTFTLKKWDIVEQLTLLNWKWAFRVRIIDSKTWNEWAEFFISKSKLKKIN